MAEDPQQPDDRRFPSWVAWLLIGGLMMLVYLVFSDVARDRLATRLATPASRSWWAKER